MHNLIHLIKERLETLEPTELSVSDDSHLHIGHAGAASGGGHFSLRIVSARFRGLSRLARHRLVYDALGELMEKAIHALSIQAFAPEELLSIKPNSSL